MAAVVPLPFTLPAADSSAKTVASGSISAPSQAVVFPAGPSYVAHARRQLRQLDFDADDEAEETRLSALNKTSGFADDDVELPEEEESKDLLARDPKDWKTQDHYAVLGLSSLRYKATPLQIKVAHRRKVLKHHPDKKAGATGLTNDDTFYKCITRAHDVLSNPEKRRQFDSVDEGIDDEAVPSGKEAESKFFALWTPVFERESRFNDEKKSGKAPELGDMNSSKDHVDTFYDFWYNFDSWRSFEYLDKEINEGSDSRDDKRYTEKKNRNDRARRKKEDNARLRSLVDKALSIDPRIKKFKADEKAAREAKKNKGKPGQAGTGNAAQLAEEKKKKEAEELKRKEDEAKQAEADKAARADAKKVKEAAKKNLKKHKKVLRDLITSNNYFEPTGTSPSASVIEAKLNGLDAITAALAEEPEKVQALRERCEKAGGADAIKKELAAVAEEKGVAKDAFA